MATTKVKLIINPAPIRALQLKAGFAAEVALFHLRERMAERMGPLSSIHLGGNLRGWVSSSLPGSVPFSQTDNLKNSLTIKAHHIDKRKPTKLADLIHIHVEYRLQTDVPYAPSLELGGPAILFAEKKYTHWDIINPLTKPVLIAARPWWLPTFHQEKIAMVEFITGTLRSSGVIP